MKLLVYKPFIFCLLAMAFTACKSGPFNLLKPASPHEQYRRKLESAGLASSAMGKEWIERASRSLQNPVSISLPYREQGYFDAGKAEAAAFSFRLEKGQKVQIKLNPTPARASIFMDIWEREDAGQLTLLAAADTLGSMLQSDVDRTGTHILRLQPELLSGGGYTLEINTGPSLDYPLKSYNPSQIRSFWGDGRDAGARSHEGIDIFSAFRTPVLAVAAGTVTRVNENTLGGRVVWFRPEGKNYTLYYAHLDEQTVSEGQQVMPGDTLGLMGNTGNARTTPPHLHLGVYTSGGSIDPLPFINPKIKPLPAITAATDRLNGTLRAGASAKLLTGTGPMSLARGTLMCISAASANSYRVQLPDNTEGYVTARDLVSTGSSLQKYTLKTGRAVYDRPDSAAAIKTSLKAGEQVEVKGVFGNYRFISTRGYGDGWIQGD